MERTPRWRTMVLAPDGTERRTRVLHGLVRIAISPTHGFVAVVAHRDGTPVLLRFAIPSLEMTELATLPIEAQHTQVAIDDEGIAIADRSQQADTVALYDGRAAITLAPLAYGPHEGARDEYVLAYGAKTIAVVASVFRPHTSDARMQVIAIDRATQARRVIYEEDHAQHWMVPFVYMAGATWYVVPHGSTRLHQLDAIDASGTRHTDIARLEWPIAAATAPDGRLALYDGHTLRIFKDGVLVGEAPFAGVMTGLAFRTVAH